MEFDANQNSKQKYRIFVYVEKCKKLFLTKPWKYILGIVILIVIIIGGMCGFDYIQGTYIPEKKLNDAVNIITANINSKNDSIKTEYALYLLDKSHVWGFEGVSDQGISSRLERYRKSAFEFIESNAYAGNPRCQFELGKMYGFGDESYYHVEMDITKAAYWFYKAVLQYYTPAYYYMAIAYRDGLGVEKNLIWAVEYLRQGAEAGCELAQLAFGDLLVRGFVMDMSSDSSRKGSHVYYMIPRSIEDAKNWWKKSADQGNETAKERLQKVYEETSPILHDMLRPRE